MNSQFNNSYIGFRPEIIKNITGENLNILDVGCATGANGHWLKNNKLVSNLVGIEINDIMGEHAKKVYDKLIIGNIENINLQSVFKVKYFDYIILGDILEHLVDPWSVLSDISDLLKSNGKIIISLPNIQHINTFFNLYIRGEWAYNERGIYDITHLRWFTLKNIRTLTKGSNLKIIKIERIFRFKDAIGSRFFPGTKLILTKCFKNLFTFQYIIVCSLLRD